MNKKIVAVFCLGMILTSASLMGQSATIASAKAEQTTVANDNRQVLKAEELPDAVKKALATDEYKGWTVKEAAKVTITGDKPENLYEVALTNGTENRNVRFKEDGTVSK